MVYFTAVPAKGTMTIRWRDRDEIKTCRSEIDINAQEYANDDLYRGSVICKIEKNVDKTHPVKGDEQ